MNLSSRSLLLVLIVVTSCVHMPQPIPDEFAAPVPSECLQVGLVIADDEHAAAGRMWMLERAPGGAWQTDADPVAVRLGRHGLAWGQDSPAPDGRRLKREGDGCAPIGVFTIPTAFGTESMPPGLKLPYIRCTEHHFGIDDIRSRHYNRIVDAREVSCDWTSPETMIPSSGCYQLGAVIGHNPRHVPGAGSCIFFHIWQGENIPTSGCTAMSAANMRRLLLWLDPAKQPRLVQFVVR